MFIQRVTEVGLEHSKEAVNESRSVTVIVHNPYLSRMEAGFKFVFLCYVALP